MIAIADHSPTVDVDQKEYNRLLGYPASATVSARAAELAAWARDWYAKHGRPWIYARGVELRVTSDGFELDGIPFNGSKLRATLERAEAHEAILVGVGAGVALELEAQRLWLEERPDEYFFLDVYGSAVVERLVTQTGARLCAWADTQGLAVLPHQSPGYPEWDIGEQPKLLQLVDPASVPERLEALESGMLRPKKSMLAVFGLTRHAERVTPLSGLAPCEECSYAPCQFRRARYRGESGYSVSEKALARWAKERLELKPLSDGGVEAVFHYEGTTCMNTGHKLEFDYRVKLGPANEGYPIREQSCTPAASDTGSGRMCEYQNKGPALLAEIDAERPMNGEPIANVLYWRRPQSPAGCYCEPASRLHKWGLALETIHYALGNRSR